MWKNHRGKVLRIKSEASERRSWEGDVRPVFNPELGTGGGGQGLTPPPRACSLFKLWLGTLRSQVRNRLRTQSKGGTRQKQKLHPTCWEGRAQKGPAHSEGSLDATSAVPPGHPWSSEPLHLTGSPGHSETSSTACPLWGPWRQTEPIAFLPELLCYGLIWQAEEFLVLRQR